MYTKVNRKRVFFLLVLFIYSGIETEPNRSAFVHVPFLHSSEYNLGKDSFNFNYLFPIQIYYL